MPGPVRVLVVDDDPSLVRFVSLLLRIEGFAVTAALGGTEGLACLGRERPDVVILDLLMPVMDGKAFYRRAREDGYEGPVLVCSASGAQAAQRELGADAYISKPFEPDELVSAVRVLTDRK